MPAPRGTSYISREAGKVTLIIHLSSCPLTWMFPMLPWNLKAFWAELEKGGAGRPFLSD